MGREDADRSTRLHQHRLVALQRAQRAHQRVETAPVARRAPGAAVDDEVVGPFGDLGVEVVLEHAQGALLGPAQRRQRRAARRSNRSRAFHVSRPSSLRQCHVARHDVQQLAAAHQFTDGRDLRREPAVVTRAAGDGVDAMRDRGGRR